MTIVKVLLIYMHSKKQAGKPRNALMLFALILEKKREEEKEREEERERLNEWQSSYGIF